MNVKIPRIDHLFVCPSPLGEMNAFTNLAQGLAYPGGIRLILGLWHQSLIGVLLHVSAAPLLIQLLVYGLEKQKRLAPTHLFSESSLSVLDLPVFNRPQCWLLQPFGM